MQRRSQVISEPGPRRRAAQVRVIGEVLDHIDNKLRRRASKIMRITPETFSLISTHNNQLIISFSF